MAEANKRGRPLKFRSAKELQAKVDQYFDSCFEEWWERVVDKQGNETWKPKTDRNGHVMMRQVRPMTISGLAVHLGTTRRTLLDYEEYDETFAHTIKQAKARIENYTEEQLYNAEARNMTGIIFNLKNNYGWQDKSEVDANIGNKDGQVFETKNVVSQLTVEELRNLAAKPIANGAYTPAGDTGVSQA